MSNGTLAEDVKKKSDAGLSVSDFAKSIKTKYPAYAKVDDLALVSKVVAKYPVYQKKLSTEAIQQIAVPNQPEKYWGFDIGHEGSVAWQFAKGAGQMFKDLFDPYVPITGKQGLLTGLITGPMNEQYRIANEEQKTQGMSPEVIARSAASGIPILGPIAAELGDRLGRRDIGGALVESLLYGLTGKKASEFKPEDVKAIVDGVEKVSKKTAIVLPIKRAAFEDRYIHAKGLDVKDKIVQASDAAEDEVGKHAQAVSKVVDQRNPNGVVDAAAEAQGIAQEFKKLVKTPIAANSWFQNLLKHAPDVPKSGLWSFEDARQFRSDVYRALRKSQGVGTAVLARVYDSLTKKLAQTAKDYGMEDSWNHYNQLRAKLTHNFGDLIDDVKNSKSGQEVVKTLGKDSGATAELLSNLKKYGLDSKEVARFIKDSKRILGTRSYKSLFKYIYSTPTGFAGYVGGRAMGLPWLPSAALGMGVGMATNYLVALSRAMRINPEILEKVLRDREIPGPKAVRTPPPPASSAPPTPSLPSSPSGPIPSTGLPSPPGTSPTETQGISGFEPRRLPAAKKELPPKPKVVGTKEAKISEQAVKGNESWTVEQYKSEIRRTADILRNPKATLEERGIAREQLKNYQEELGKLTGSKTVAEGVHGKGRLAEQSKARERIARNRELARGAREAELKQHATQQPILIPELEEAVQEHNPHGLEILKSLRKKKAISDEEYVFYLLEAMDSKGQ